MVNQLSQFQEESDWFATDERLRRDAVTETLMYWTGLREEAVPSRRAQESWKRIWDHRQRLSRGEDLADPAWVAEVRAHHDRVVNDRDEWLDIWSAWRGPAGTPLTVRRTHDRVDWRSLRSRGSCAPSATL